MDASIAQVIYLSFASLTLMCLSTTESTIESNSLKSANTTLLQPDNTTYGDKNAFQSLTNIVGNNITSFSSRNESNNIINEELEKLEHSGYLFFPHIYRAFIRAGKSPEDFNISAACSHNLANYYKGLYLKKAWAWNKQHQGPVFSSLQNSTKDLYSVALQNSTKDLYSVALQNSTKDLYSVALQNSTKDLYSVALQNSTKDLYSVALQNSTKDLYSVALQNSTKDLYSVALQNSTKDLYSVALQNSTKDLYSVALQNSTKDLYSVALQNSTKDLYSVALQNSTKDLYSVALQNSTKDLYSVAFRTAPRTCIQ
ncbi:hypothetical protein BgiBS90_030370 [Biomphalaria glabrata]|nr:hypothetical protein BgiBS90_030370 [Biomphalaria glabrata]